LGVGIGLQKVGLNSFLQSLLPPRIYSAQYDKQPEISNHGKLTQNAFDETVYFFSFYKSHHSTAVLPRKKAITLLISCA
jgi:hypothetical protein